MAFEITHQGSNQRVSGLLQQTNSVTEGLIDAADLLGALRQLIGEDLSDGSVTISGNGGQISLNPRANGYWVQIRTSETSRIVPKPEAAPKNAKVPAQ